MRRTYTIVSQTIPKALARARMASPRACPCTMARKGGGDADYPHSREPWRCLRFWCSTCGLYQPWCKGAADAWPALCDDCAPAPRAA